MRITVLMGGTSEERDVSLASGVEIARALREADHEVVAFDTGRGVLSPETEAELLEAGVGRLPPARAPEDLMQTGDLASLTDHPEVVDTDLFFVALHGGRGEDGTLQAMLDVVGKPYTGSGVQGCVLAMDKDLTKRILRDAGIPTPDWITGHPAPGVVEDELGLPVIAKAACGGSSLRLTIAYTRPEVEEADRVSADFDDRVVWERYVRGREFTVGIVGDEALPVGEIIPEHEIFDYECKYQPGMAKEIFPAEIPGEMARRLQKMALDVHRLLRMRDFSRVDFIVDLQGRPWCLEANALPGMTANSLLPKAAQAAGSSFPDLCDRIATLAHARRSAVE